MASLARLGECKRCGRCCFYDPVDGSACKHLRVVRGVITCSIYEARPQMCRDYPVDKSDLLEGCGFYFEETRDVK